MIALLSIAFGLFVGFVEGYKFQEKIGRFVDVAGGNKKPYSSDLYHLFRHCITGVFLLALYVSPEFTWVNLVYAVLLYWWAFSRAFSYVGYGTFKGQNKYYHLWKVIYLRWWWSWSGGLVGFYLWLYESFIL